jgi:glycosyltransferase involved in cell wall biosynthesis
MDTEKLNKLEKTIKNLEEKNSILYFFVQDTNGNAKGGIRYIYQIALTLFNNGYNVVIIHEKNNYKGVGDWLGSEYTEIPHESIENQSLRISPEDFVIIPEIFGYIIEQITNLPCGKVVLCQAYDNIFETLKPGMTWADFGFFKCITTTNEQKNYIESIMRNVTLDVIEPYIPTNFSKKPKPSKPIISIHTRDQRDTMKIIKSFYIKYPQFRWITFRDMRGLNQEEFSNYLKDSFVSVWVDDISGFGTFPIESMLSNTPVIGKIPNMKPEWMNEDNGIWTYELNKIIDIIGEFIQNWLEDNINEELYTKGYETAINYQNKENFDKKIIETFDSFIENRRKSFAEQFEKIKIEEEV